MEIEHFAVVHLVNVIAAEDYHMARPLLFEHIDVLENRVGQLLEVIRRFEGTGIRIVAFVRRERRANCMCVQNGSDLAQPFREIVDERFANGWRDGANELANLIRENKTVQIPSAIQTGKAHGMQTLDDAIMDVLTKKWISPAAANITRVSNTLGS